MRPPKPIPIDVASLTNKLKATPFAQGEIQYLPTTGSTNDVARDLAEKGAPEGTIVIAESQIKGRGRLGRTWHSPLGAGLYFSIVLRPRLDPSDLPKITLLAGTAVAESIEKTTGLHPVIKWPNDLLVGDRKVGGILTELVMKGERLEYAIVGLGLNVNLDFTPPEVAFLREQATSLARELGAPVAREPLLACILNRLEVHYLALCDGWSPHQAWAARLVTLGQRVAVSGPGDELEGWAEGVDPDGGLLLRLKDGQVVRVLAGDVSLRLCGRPAAAT